MKCPTCKETHLAITQRQNIEIDYCPECRGVWLDRGELDKLIERAERPSGEWARTDDRERRYRDDDYRHKRHKSFLRDLFD
ncbi:MAG: zf-TFIIB domain-containing protein [Gammaproteobacteria bacterium]